MYGCDSWSLKVFEKRVLRRIFGLKDETIGGWRALLNEELLKLNSPPNIITMIK
jgi:hypothetical protein